MTSTARAEKGVNIQKLIEEAVKKAVSATVLFGMEKAKADGKEAFKKTEQRLYAYPELKKNIEKYYADIDDVQLEGATRKSKDLVFFSAAGMGGTRLSAEEIMEGRIVVLQKKIYRDQSEIDEIDFALSAISGDEYYQAVALKYFDGKTDEMIAEEINCDQSTVRRNKNRLVRKLAIKLYGAQALS